MMPMGWRMEGGRLYELWAVGKDVWGCDGFVSG